MPSKPFRKDSQAVWVNILDFYDKSRKGQFQAVALAALDEFLTKRGEALRP